MNMLNTILEIPFLLGTSVLTPILLIVISLLIGMKVKEAFKYSCITGFSLVGISIIMNQLGILIMEIATIVTEQLGIVKPITDMGRSYARYISDLTEIGLYVIPISILINIIMLVFKATRTINIDFWSMWLAGFCGVVTQMLTDNIWFGLMSMVAAVVATLVLSDMAIGGVEETTGIKGVTFTDLQSTAFVPFAHLANIGDGILPKKFSKNVSFGNSDSWIQCICLMVFITIIAMMGGRELAGGLRLAMTGGAIMFVGQGMFQLFKDGISPIGEKLETFSSEKLKMYGSVKLGISPVAVMSVGPAVFISVVMVPITLLLVKYLPYNSFLPEADLIILPYITVLIVLVCRGKIIQSLLASIMAVIAALYSATLMAGIFTQVIVNSNPTEYTELGLISNLFGAGNPVTLLITQLSTFGIAGVGLLLIFILLITTWNFNRLNGHVKIYVKKPKALLASAIDDITKETEESKKKYGEAVSQKRQSLRDAIETDKIGTTQIVNKDKDKE